MKIEKTINNPLDNEHVIDVYPPLQTGSQSHWQRRLKFFTGRSLTDVALKREQSYRAGYLAMRGRMMSAGVKSGLDVILEQEELVWMEETFPAGASRLTEDENQWWNWVASNPVPFSGRLALQSGVVAGEHQDGFSGATAPMKIAAGDLLIAYVYLDPDNPPSEIMLQWHDPQGNGSWEHRAYWGANNINLGTDGTTSRYRLGDLPASGQWARLEVPAQQVGLLGGEVDGIIFTLYDGRATWDHIGQASTFYRITPGTGITVKGEDVVVPKDWRVAIGNLPVYAPVDIVMMFAQSLSLSLLLQGGLYGFASLLLQNDPHRRARDNEQRALSPRKLGVPLQFLIEAGIAAQLPPVGILILQPIVTELVGEFDSNDPCELDPQNYAFEDWQMVDGCRLLLYSWPVEWLNLPEVGGDLREPTILSLWRNRLAHAIFRREKANSPRQIMPWEAVGVPIALIGFDDNWKPLFSDRHAVVRQGGKPKQRSPLIANVGNPFLWQAQIQQFAEQLTEMNLVNLTELAPCFRYLPPVGILPKNAIEARAGKDHFFPAAYAVQAAPVSLDQLELVVESSASLRPFDTFKTDESEQVQVLVPVPSQWYEPQLLKVEKVDPIFQKTINDLLPQRTELLYRQELVRRRLAAIIKSITGKLPEFQDPEQVEEETIHSIPFSSTRVLEGTGLYLFKGATATLSIATGDKLTVYVFLDPDNPPSRLEVWWLIDNSLIRRAYWGIRDLDVTTSRYMGVLPALGQWVQLTVPANLLNLQGTTVYGMAVEAEDGRLAWGHAGKTESTPGSDIVWVGNELPTGAQTGDNQGWEWISAREKLEILAESEEEIAARQIPFASTQALIPAGVIGSQSIYYVFTEATEQLSVNPSESLTAYVYIDPNNLPTRLELWWTSTGSDSRLRQAYWGELDIDNLYNRYMGPLPISRRWVRLEVPVSLLGLAVDTAVVGMAFSANGRVAWAHAGKSTAGAPPEDDTVWVGNELPAGSRIVLNDGWTWVELNPERTPFGEALPPLPEAIVEADYGTTITGGVRVVIAVEELKKTLKEKSPLDKDAIKLDKLDALKNKVVSLAALPNGVEIPPDLANKIRYDSRRKVLIVQGILSAEERDRLKQLNDDRDYQEAIDILFNAGQGAVQLEAILLKIPASLTGKIRYEAKRQLLTIQGVMSVQEKKQLLALADGNSNADKEFKKVVELLYEQSQDNQDLEKLEELGLEKFIDFLQAKIDSADDKIDLGFVQIQTNMYRIRQYILGTDAASRLAISPTLAEIAQRKSAAVTEKELSDYIAQIKGKKVEPIEDRSATPSPSNASETESVSPPADANISNVESSSLLPIIEQISPARRLELSEIQLVKKIPLERALNPIEKVQKQSPLVGKVPRILTVSERLNQPAPQVARDFSFAGRQNIVTSLSDVGILKGLEVPGLEKVTFSQLKNLAVRAEIVAEIESGASEDAVEDDELSYFSSAVKALDRTAAALRLAEMRTQEYRDIIDLCQEVLDKLDTPLNQANQRLSAIADELAETRHDIAVARSLLAEEQARVESINQRRDRIIEEHVSFLVFHRPRFVGSGVDVPSRPLDSGLVEAPVPACLRQHRALPPELEEAIELLREAPTKWFTKLSLLLKQLDQIETITNAISIAQVNAKFQFPVQLLALTQATGKKQDFGQAIQRVFAAQQQVVKQYRQQTVQFDTRNLVSQSWTQVRDRARELLSWGDLIDGRHKRNQVAQEAARQFENVARILACLYSNFAEVLPAIRLDWAERLSQYDRPVNLRNLASLPRWGEIERLERQEMQTLVDWLYQQVDRQQSEAVALMSDLIRICILLASHAPVNQIIVGRVARATTTLNPGTRVDLTVATSQVRVGMEVLMYGTDNTVVAKGVVENLATGLAETRVVKTFKPNRQLPEKALVQLTEPGGFERSPLISGISGIKMTSF